MRVYVCVIFMLLGLRSLNAQEPYFTPTNLDGKISYNPGFISSTYCPRVGIISQFQQFDSDKTYKDFFALTYLKLPSWLGHFGFSYQQTNLSLTNRMRNAYFLYAQKKQLNGIWTVTPSVKFGGINNRVDYGSFQNRFEINEPIDSISASLTNRTSFDLGLGALFESVEHSIKAGVFLNHVVRPTQSIVDENPVRLPVKLNLYFSHTRSFGKHSFTPIFIYDFNPRQFYVDSSDMFLSSGTHFLALNVNHSYEHINLGIGLKYFIQKSSVFSVQAGYNFNWLMVSYGYGLSLRENQISGFASRAVSYHQLSVHYTLPCDFSLKRERGMESLRYLSIAGKDNPTPQILALSTKKDSSAVLKDMKEDEYSAMEINPFKDPALEYMFSAEKLKTHKEDWQLSFDKRLSFVIRDKNNVGISNARIRLVNTFGKATWETKTDNFGRAELWENLFLSSGETGTSKIEVNYLDSTYYIASWETFPNGVNFVQLPIEKMTTPATHLDVLFAVDVSGSMKNEMGYIKDQLHSVTEALDTLYADSTYLVGSIFYRAKGNSYEMKMTRFEYSSVAFQNVLHTIQAGEGGVEPIEEVLDSALHAFSWRDSTHIRMLFLFMDEAPMFSSSMNQRLHKAIRKAALMGVKIIPVVTKSFAYNPTGLEYLSNGFALATNGSSIYFGTPALTSLSNEDTDTVKAPGVVNDQVLSLSQILLQSIKNEETEVSDHRYFTNKSDTSLIGFIEKVLIDSSHSKAKTFIRAIDVYDTLMVTDETHTLEESKVQYKSEPRTFKFYPNITDSIFTIEINGKPDLVFVADVTGRLIKQVPWKNEDKLDVNISGLPDGLYKIQVYASDRWYAGRIIKR